MSSEPKFEGLFDSRLSPEKALRANAKYAEEQRVFNESVDQILAKDKSNPSEILNGLRNIEKSAENPSSPNLMKLFTSYRDVGAFADMDRLYENSTNDGFKKSYLVREFLAVAYNKTGQAVKALQTMESIRAEACDPGYPRPDLMNGEVFGAMAKAYIVQQGAAENLCKSIESGDTADIEKNRAVYAKAFGLPENAPLPTSDFLKTQAEKLAVTARDTYAEGFNVNFEYYPGINAVYGDLTLGNFERAQKTAELVQLATIRDGGLEQGNYWTSMTMLEASLIKGTDHKYIESTLNKIISGNEIPAWQLESTVGAWKSRVYPALEKLEADLGPQQGKAVSSILESFRFAEKKLAEGMEANALQNAPSSLQDQLVTKYTHFYRGMSIYDAQIINNNFRYGGIITQTSVTRRDRYEFGRLLDMPAEGLMEMLGGNPHTLPAAARGGIKLGDIKDPEAFIETTQKIVRQNFGTVDKGLEVIDGVDHKNQYDHVIESLNKISGIPTDASVRAQYDSRTSLAAEFAKGLGDCRHHAQAMQLLFDTWQHKNFNEHIREARDAESPKERAQAIKAFHKLDAVKLSTLDVEVYVPIKREKMYVPERPDANVGHTPKDKAFVKSDKEEKDQFEEHTTSALSLKDPDGNVVSLKLVDSFYNQTYKWANQRIDGAAMALKNGKIAFSGGFLEHVLGAPDHKVPAELRPAPYSGDRGATAANDPGDIWERGIRVDKFDLVDSLKQRPQINEQLRNITNYILGVPEVSVSAAAPPKMREPTKTSAPPADPAKAGYRGRHRLAERGAQITFKDKQIPAPEKKPAAVMQRKPRNFSPTM